MSIIFEQNWYSLKQPVNKSQSNQTKTVIQWRDPGLVYYCFELISTHVKYKNIQYGLSAALEL